MRAEASFKRRNIEFGAIPLSVQEFEGERGIVGGGGCGCGCGWLSVGEEAMRRWSRAGVWAWEAWAERGTKTGFA